MKIKICLFVLGIFFALMQSGSAEMSSTNYTIKTSVVSGGGAPIFSSGYYSNGTLGQTIASEPLLSADYDLYSGFWYTVFPGLCIWDLYPVDGDVDGSDLFRFINPPFDASGIDDFASEFGRTECF